MYDIYGHTGGEKDNEAAGRTNDTMKIIITDAKEQPRGPIPIVGDLNASTARIDKLAVKLKDRRLIDVGAQAEKYGNTKEDYTCTAHGAKQPTRRDYVFANPEAFELIGNLWVDHDAGFDMHDVFKIKIFCEDDFKQVTTQEC